ncbi:MAG: hypothetical protein HOP29_20340 [Phycisphaerales bacterium]|nr:hypothetical protein [Phycisphaerales bacterium]
MLYAAMTFWMLAIVLSAWGVHQLWSGMVKPRVVNTILLPGTLVAQLGHVLGMLITGATVTNTALYQDESGEPQTTRDAKPRIPLIGPIAVGLLPLLACATAIALSIRFIGGDRMDGLPDTELATTLPTALAGFWQLVRDTVTVVEHLMGGMIQCLPGDWRMGLLTYLLICLTVRMAPFPGNLRGSLGAILLVGVLSALIGIVYAPLTDHVARAWGLLSLTASILFLLLILSTILRGCVGLMRLLMANA